MFLTRDESRARADGRTRARPGQMVLVCYQLARAPRARFPSRRGRRKRMVLIM